MQKLFVQCLLCLLITARSFPQSFTNNIDSQNTHPASQDKLSWQRLNLRLSTIFYNGMKLSRIGFDSSLLHTSRTLGINRLVLIGEGIDDPDLINHSNWFDERDPGKGINLLSKSKAKEHLELMILLGGYYAFQPFSYKRYRDSVEYFLNTAVAESKKINEKRLGRIALCLLGKMYGQGNDTINTPLIFDKLIKECEEYRDRKTLAMAYYYRGFFTAYNQTNLQDKMDWLQRAMDIYHELKDKEGEITVFTNIAFLHLVQQQFAEGNTAFIKALELEKSIGYPYTHYTTDHIAMLGMVQGDFAMPLKYTLETIRSSEASKDSIGWSEFYLRLGQLYYMEGGRSEESLKWMVKALDRFILENDGSIYSTLVNVLSLMNEKTGREKEALDLVLHLSRNYSPSSPDEQVNYNLSFATCYYGLKQYVMARKYVATADSIQALSPGMSFAGVYQKKAIDDMTANINFANGEYKKVKNYIDANFADSNRVFTLSDDLRDYQRLLFIDSVFNDNASAVKHYKLYTQLLDSSFKVSKIRQAEELKVIYETEEKQNQITALSQKAVLEQSNLKQANRAKNLTIAGIVALLIIAGLLFRQSRLGKRTNRIVVSKNNQLEHLLTEKQWLLKEIHHRVKNNLQTVVSLLESQSAYLKNSEARLAIQDSQNRVHAMSLIHQKLYQSENVASINMAVYLPELVHYLRDSFNVQNKIKFDLQVESIELDVSQAIPIGLILNEAMTNSIKYAFPVQSPGNTITVHMQQTMNNHVQLIIADNGKGLPGNLNINEGQGLGLKLMEGLTGDIEGNFSITSNAGTWITINFTANTPLYKFIESKLLASTQPTA